MTGQAIVCKLKDLQEIPGADKIQQATIYGETVIISKDYKEGELGILFDCETQVSHEYAHHNNLYRHTHLNVDAEKSGYLEDNRRIRPIRLKGVQCSAMWMPIESLVFTGISADRIGKDHQYVTEGFQFTEINGVEICKKYVKPAPTQGSGKDALRGRYLSKASYVPTFKEHYDTDQWARNTHCVKEGDLVIITEKLHGTSGRCGYLPVNLQFGWFKRFLSRFVDLQKTQYNFMVGSRRVVKSIGGKEAEKKAHYYETDLWTKVASAHFEGKLEKGETVYFEIVGYTPDGQPIMGTHSNNKLKNFMSKEEYKEFINKYGEETIFSYGCPNPMELKKWRTTEDGTTIQEGWNKVFIYRITTTNEDGETIDLSWSQVKRRSEKLGVAHVPELWRGIYEHNPKADPPDKNDRYLNHIVENFTNDDSKEFPMHLREGVCIRVEGGSLIPRVFKHKNYYFKVLEGIIKDNDNFVDLEETN